MLRKPENLFLFCAFIMNNNIINNDDVNDSGDLEHNFSSEPKARNLIVTRARIIIIHIVTPQTGQPKPSRTCIIFGLKLSAIIILSKGKSYSFALSPYGE